MKTNRDDAPDYISSKKKPGLWRMVAILSVGSAITWGVIALFAKPIVINVDQLKQAIHVDGKPLFSQQPAPQPYPDPVGRALNSVYGLFFFALSQARFSYEQDVLGL